MKTWQSQRPLTIPLLSNPPVERAPERTGDYNHSSSTIAIDFTLPRLMGTVRGTKKIIQRIHKACLLPELRPLLAKVRINTDETLPLPFEVYDSKHITLGTKYLGTLAATTLHLRHALEIALWQRLSGNESSFERRGAIALLACRVAAIYYNLLPPSQQESCLPYVPVWMLTAIGRMSCIQPATRVSELIKEPFFMPLLRLQGMDIDSTKPPPFLQKESMLTGVFDRVIEIAAPLEYLLTSGGDTRLLVDSETGLSVYGCSPRPRPSLITFSSSTATSVSEQAFCSAEALRQRLIQAACRGGLETAFEQQIEYTKREILSVLGLDRLDGVEIILTPSGTDGELSALHLAFTRPCDKIINIIVAPEETGSGVVRAAAGYHFATKTALGESVIPGSPINGYPSSQIRVEQVGVRDENGNLISQEMLRRSIEQIIERSIREGARVLLHYVHSTKTGLSVPGIETIYHLHEFYRPFVDVVIDACQMRVAEKTLEKFLERGFMVLITGSKFFTGPPFSGALIIPKAITSRGAGQRPPPSGLAAYASYTEWPKHWRSVRNLLSRRYNYGLLLRWTAALWEMRAFYAVPRGQRRKILARFGRIILRAITLHPHIELLESRTPESAGFDREWDSSVPTIFTFLLFRADSGGARRALSLDAARTFYHWLNTDISPWLPEEATAEERSTAATCCHVGQPVHAGKRDGQTLGALRISAGARLVSGVAFNPALGNSMAQRFSREVRDALLILEKITVLAKYMDYIRSAADSAHIIPSP